MASPKTAALWQAAIGIGLLLGTLVGVAVADLASVDDRPTNLRVITGPDAAEALR